MQQRGRPSGGPAAIPGDEMGFAWLLVIGATMLAGETAEEKPVLSDPVGRASYSLGHQIGLDLARQDTRIDPHALRRGLLDGLAGAEPAIAAETMEEALRELKRKVVATEREHDRLGAERHRKRGEDFLARNARDKGVVTLPSGLQYRILQKGRGRRPLATDKVIVHYRGTTLDGSEFHDSRKRPGEPEVLHVSGVVRGLTEALQKMKVGSRWQVFLPPELAYGRRGPLADHTVVFDVELIAIEETP